MAINPADFVAVIDNPYFPLTPGTTYVYESPDGSVERTFEVTRETLDILGVACTVVRDISREDGEITETTADYFAQDIHGNVWYFGEDTQEFPSGSTAGTWRAGVDGAEPGFIMLASPAPGDEYDQEVAPGVAEDHAEVIDLDSTAKVPYGKLTGLLRTAETTPLEPDVLEHKLYLQGLGEVLVVNKVTGEREELLVLVRVEGTDGDDVLNAYVGPDEMNGLGGDDNLSGLGGDDTMEGGAGNDTLNGGDGEDVLIGGAAGGSGPGETDQFTGGAHEDEFVFVFEVAGAGGEIESDASNIVITDATRKDELVLDSGGSAYFDTKKEREALVDVTDDGTDVTVAFQHEDGGIVSITLEGLGANPQLTDSLKDLKKLIELDYM